VCFVRPTEESVRVLCDLLRAGTYGEFYVFFSSVLAETHLQALAESDENEVVRQVQEMYASFLAVDPTVFTLELPRSDQLLRFSSVPPSTRSTLIDPIVEGIASFLLSVKRRPAIRAQRSSEICKRIAGDVARLAYEREQQLFDFRRNEGASAQLVILDRLDDPVTPLLSQWTYQAMIHELIGIKNNRARIDDGAGGQKQDIVVSSASDGFFKKTMYSNYGDLGSAVKKLVDDFQAVSKLNKQIDSIEDMQRFVESFPEFRQQSGNVSKHVSLMSELSRVISENRLMNVSEVEQEIVCGNDRAYAFAGVVRQLSDPSLKNIACLKLVLLFALRYEKEGERQIAELTRALAKRNVEPAYQRLIRDALAVAGENRRTGDLFGNRTFFSRAQKMVGGLKGADNVYTQHQPLLVQTLENLFKNKVKESDYPFVGSGGASGSPKEIFVFIVGGITYEEARFVNQMNEAGSGTHVTLGGTSILNSAGFLTDLVKATQECAPLV
jgi:vacuolar protein sorting-associated protein 45